MKLELKTLTFIAGEAISLLYVNGKDAYTTVGSYFDIGKDVKRRHTFYNPLDNNPFFTPLQKKQIVEGLNSGNYVQSFINGT